MADRCVFFATCAPGVEPVLHDEVRQLGWRRVERQVGGVRFEAPPSGMVVANLQLRTAVRVLWRQGRFLAADGDALYRGVAAVDWSGFVGPDGSLAIDAQSRESALDNTMFVAQRAKDAIVDQLRARSGRRPSVDKVDPDLRVHVHLYRDRATLSVDTSGASLHKRGWRRYQGRAPLAETLAAAVVMFAGWDRRAPLLDPFCGSGTILIEAALLAAGAAPGAWRSFGFERWPSHDPQQLAAARAALPQIELPKKLTLRGADIEPAHVDGTLANLDAVGLADRVQIERAGVADFAPRSGWNAWIATNPPWGERVGGDRVGRVYDVFGQRLRERCSGYYTAVLCSDPALLRRAGLPAERVAEIVHGGIVSQLQCGRLP